MNQIDQRNNTYRFRKGGRAISLFLACVITFTTTYALILPAITLDEQTAESDPAIVLASSPEATPSNAEAIAPTSEEPPAPTASAPVATAAPSPAPVPAATSAPVSTFAPAATNAPAAKSTPKAGVALSFTESFGGTIVAVSAPVGALPEGTKMTLAYKDPDPAVVRAAEQHLAKADDVELLVLDITFVRPDGKTASPLQPLEYSVRDGRIAADAMPQILHVDENNNVHPIAPESNASRGDEVRFRADDRRSVYVLVFPAAPEESEPDVAPVEELAPVSAARQRK